MRQAGTADQAITDTDLAGYRAAQRLAYDCVETVAASLEPGTSEREAAGRMAEYCRDRGVTEWFHKPFAWFGDRAAFRNFVVDTQFFPTRRTLRDGEPYILDVAPVLDGYVADVGYTHCNRPHAAIDLMLVDLLRYRELIVDLASSGTSMADIYRSVDAAMSADGYTNRHARYPLGVIGHKLGRSPGRLDRATIGRFGTPSLRFLAGELTAEFRATRNGVVHHGPFWNGSKRSDHAPSLGMWAVEPHLAMGRVGAKFEEILVIDHDGVRWLDDDLPHVVRARELAQQNDLVVA